VATTDPDCQSRSCVSAVHLHLSQTIAFVTFALLKEVLCSLGQHVRCRFFTRLTTCSLTRLESQSPGLAEAQTTKKRQLCRSAVTDICKEVFDVRGTEPILPVVEDSHRWIGAIRAWDILKGPWAGQSHHDLDIFDWQCACAHATLITSPSCAPPV
jgi:hypothetical protein